MKTAEERARDFLNHLYGDDWHERYTRKEMLDPAIALVKADRKEQREACWENVKDKCIWLYINEEEEISHAILNAGVEE